METWPSVLPNPSTNFSSSVDCAVVRTNMDSGYKRQRKRFTQQMRTIKAKWEMSDTELAIFEAWWKYKISAGADWFLCNLPLGSGMAQYTVRFTDNYDHSHKGVLFWNVSATLECLVGSPLTEAELNVILTS